MITKGLKDNFCSTKLTQYKILDKDFFLNSTIYGAKLGIKKEHHLYA